MIGIIGSVTTAIIILYIRRSRLKITVRPNKRWLFDTIHSPDINIQITNLGYEKTEVEKVHLILKNGTETKIVNEDLMYNAFIPIESKTTIITLINCSEVIKKTDFNNYSITRVKVFTTNGKVYSSRWMPVKEILDCWLEGSLKGDRIV